VRATLELSPGSFVDDDLRHTHADLLYGVRTRTGGDALVHLLMEHQSTFDARMPLRLLHSASSEKLASRRAPTWQRPPLG
jgi:predicted transposase YdaD